MMQKSGKVRDKQPADGSVYNGFEAIFRLFRKPPRPNTCAKNIPSKKRRDVCFTQDDLSYPVYPSNAPAQRISPLGLVFTHDRLPGEAMKDQEGVANMKNLGQNIAWLLSRLKD